MGTEARGQPRGRRLRSRSSRKAVSLRTRSRNGLRYETLWIRQHSIQQFQQDNRTDQSEKQCPPIHLPQENPSERQMHQLMVPSLQRVPIVSKALFQGQTSRARG